MKKSITILFCLVSLAGCRKHSGGPGGPLPPGTVAGVEYDDATFHRVLSYEFDYQGSQLIRILQQSIDTDALNYVPPFPESEHVAYSFHYAGDSVRPVSYVVTDTVFMPTLSTVTPYKDLHFQLGYNPSGGIISDSLLDSIGVNASPIFRGYYFSYYDAGINVDMAEAYSGESDQIHYAGNSYEDWYSGLWSVFSFGSTPNPLYDPAIGNSYAPLFLYFGEGHLPGPFIIPIDFYSRHLPQSGQGFSTDVNFSWETNIFGRVTGGMAVPVGNSSEYGTTKVTYTYR